MPDNENDLIIQVTLDPKKTKKGFDKVKSDASIVGKKAGKNLGTQFSQAFNRNIRNIGVLLVAAVGIRKVADSFLDLGTSIAEVNTIATGLTKTNAELAKEFILLSSQFGGSASAQAKSFYQIISAGITDARKANNLLIASNKLAIGGLATQAAAIDLLTSAVNSFSSTNLTGSRAADILFATVRLGKTRVDELASSLGLILPTAAAIGVSFEDTAAALAALTTKGVSTALAVTQLNAVFTAVLKKQREAASQGKRVADAFSLQALKTKGLALFLDDLNQALGGSEEQLTKLLGRVEGSKAILSLSADGFDKLRKNIDELKNSAGAADRAFAIINNTVSQQLKLAFSNLLGIVTTFANRLGSGLVESLKSLNSGLRFLLINIDSVIERLIQLGRVTLATVIILNRALIVNKLAAGFLVLKTAVLTTAVAFKTNLAIGLALGQTKLIAFIGATKAAVVGLRILRTAIKLTQAIITFGLIFVIDELIGRFVKLRSEGATIGNVFTIIGNKIKIGILKAIRELIRILIIDLPRVGKIFGNNLGRTFVNLTKDIIAATEENENLFRSFNKLKNVTTPVVEEFKKTGKAIRAETIIIFDTLTNTFTGFSTLIGNTFVLFADNISKVNKFSKEQLQELANGFGQTFAQGITRSITTVVNAIQAGQNAFEALGKSILGIIGDLAIFVGQFIVATGIAKLALTALPGGAAIAAGLGLIALGTVLKTLSGSSFVGGTASVGGSGSAGGDSLPPQATIAPDEELEKTTAVTVNVEGTVLDPIAVGQQIAEILDETFNAGASTIQVNTA